MRITFLNLTCDDDNEALDDLARPSQVSRHGRPRSEVSKSVMLDATILTSRRCSQANFISGSTTRPNFWHSP